MLNPQESHPEWDDSGRRILALLASLRHPEADADLGPRFHAGRAVLERLALSALGNHSHPKSSLSSSECLSALRYLACAELVNPIGWWRDASDGPSHVVGFQLALETIASSLELSDRQ